MKTPSASTNPASAPTHVDADHGAVPDSGRRPSGIGAPTR